jgi:malonyl-CoA/methylmalonyl-CoA synthetase
LYFYFKGDTAQFFKNLHSYKIVGRTSVDVIKSGGHKISALDVEKVLNAHDCIEEAAVMGLPDETWGQRVFALLVVKKDHIFDQDALVAWCQIQLPKFQVPSVIKVIGTMPKNQLGKVNKRELVMKYENSV